MFCFLNAGQQIAVSCCFSLPPYTINCSLTVHLCVQCQLLWLGKRTCWRWSKWIWCTLDNASCSSFSFLFLWFFLFYCFLFFVLVCPLSLSLSLSLLVLVLCFFFFFVCICLLVFVFWSVVQTGRAGGAGILGGKAGALALVGQCFPLSVFVFPSLTLRSSFPGSFFFCPFVLLCLLVLPFAFCVYHSLPVFCVSTLCLSPVFVFVRPLFILGVLSIFFPFVFVLCSCLSNGMHRGGEKDVTMICCRFRWIGMKEMNSLLWNSVVLS